MLNFSFFTDLYPKMKLEEINTGTILQTPQMTDEQYDSIKYIVESCGGHWRERFHGFFFPESANETADKLNLVSEDFVRKHIQQNHFQIENQFYETPLQIAREMVELADIKKTDYALEPSAGRGMIAQLMAEKTHHLFCLEPNRENFEILKAKIPTLSARLYQMRFESFFKQSKKNQFDVAILNPPFSQERDITHIKMAYDMLKPNGRLVALAAENSLFYYRPSTLSFLSFLEKVPHSIKTLPYGSFSTSGTSVDVVQIFIQKEA